MLAHLSSSLNSRKLFHDLRKCLAAHGFTLKDLFKSVMAYARLAFKLPNSDLEDVRFNVFTRDHLFRLLIFEGLEFNKTQVLALFPSTVGLFTNVPT